MKRRRLATSPPLTWDDVEQIRVARDILQSERWSVARESRRVDADLQRLMDESQRLKQDLQRLDDRIAEKNTEHETALQSWFQDHCKRLRGDDPTFTLVDGQYPDGYGKHLGKALQGNTSVASLELSLDEILTVDQGNENLDLLLLHIKTSPAMRSIKLDDADFRWEQEYGLELVGLFLNAMAENPHIERFIGWCEIPPEPFCHFMSKKATTIKELVFHNTIWDDVPTEEQRSIGVALGKATTLESLSLLFDDEAMDILLQLKEYAPNSRLRKLKLREYNDFVGDYDNDIDRWQAVAQFLRDGAPMLQHLVLDYFEFDHQRVGSAVAALRNLGSCRPAMTTTTTSRTSPATAAPCKLTLKECTHLDDKSIDAFVHFMQEKATPSDSTGNIADNNDSSTMQHSSQALELCLEETSCWRKKASALVAMMHHSPAVVRNMQPSSLSSGRLHTLTVNPSSVERFFPTLTRNIDTVHLYALNLTELNDFQCYSLSESLPSWSSIRELTVPTLPDIKLLDSFRENGSLFDVTIHDISGMNEADLMRISAFCKRNIFFHQHLVGRQHGADTGDHAQCDLPKKTVPGLLYIAQQVPKAMVSRVIGCLLKARKKTAGGL